MSIQNHFLFYILEMQIHFFACRLFLKSRIQTCLLKAAILYQIGRYPFHYSLHGHQTRKKKVIYRHLIVKDNYFYLHSYCTIQLQSPLCLSYSIHCSKFLQCYFLLFLACQIPHSQ